MAVVTLIVLATHPVSAEESRSGARASDTHFSSIARDLWQLDDSEVARLDELVSIERAFSDVDRLTPYEILGKYAETTQDARRYAERYTRAMADHQRRSLRWAVTVANVARQQEQQVQNAMLGDPLISEYLASIREGGPSPITAERWHLHVPAECPDCDALIQSAVAELSGDRIQGLDIVFLGMQQPDQDVVREWLEAAGLSIEDVRGDRVTVNLDSDAWRDERAGDDRAMLVQGSTGRILERL